MPRGRLEQLVVDELRKIINARGLTQARAAVLLDVSAKHLSQVLRGNAHLSFSTLNDWSERLGVQWDVAIVDLLAEPSDAVTPTEYTSTQPPGHVPDGGHRRGFAAE